jgi:adenylate cyclase
VQRGAAVIVFDMDFRRSRDAHEDQILAQAIAAANRVVLFEHLNGRLQPIEDLNGRHQGAVWLESVEPPLPELAAAARALAPFPLPKLNAAVEQYWTFKSSTLDTPTMPAVALQMYALSNYQQWRELLIRSMQMPLSDLPGHSSEIRTPQQLRALMLETRALFEQQPELAGRISAALASRDTGNFSRHVHSALLNLYAGDSGRYLNYYGPPGTISTVPYHAVIKGEDPNVAPAAMDFTGKVVFVGYSDLFDPGQPDRFYTVFTRDDGVDLSGVEIAATAFANLHAGQSVNPLSIGATLGLLLAFGLIVGTLTYLVPAVYGVMLAMSLSVLYVFAAQLSFNNQQSWWPMATPLLLQLPLALISGLYGQYRLEHRRVLHISQAIRAYVPEDVSSILTATGFDARSIDRVTYGTCLATDMAGFSTLAERMSPGELAGFLNAYFDVLAQALKRHGVKITEFRADAIMCAWTGSADDDSVRCLPVRAALAADQDISRFNLQRELSGNLRIGLADGEFYVGHAGGGGHFVYSIVGDCANTASRIEGLNKHLGTRLLATLAVTKGQDDLLVRYLGKFRFVGKSESLPIVEIVALRSSATAAQRELCERFACAQAAFEHNDLKLAIEEFERLAVNYPHDSATRFLLTYCKSRLGSDTALNEPGVIIMTTK